MTEQADKNEPKKPGETIVEKKIPASGAVGQAEQSNQHFQQVAQEYQRREETLQHLQLQADQETAEANTEILWKTVTRSLGCIFVATIGGLGVRWFFSRKKRGNNELRE